MNTFTMTSSSLFKLLSATIIALFIAGNVNAQKLKTIGNKPRSGSSNTSFEVIKGNEIAIKMKVGKKPVQLLKLNFTVDNRGSDTLKFKVNIYEFNDTIPGKNYVTTQIPGVIIPGKDRITVSLAPYNLVVSGTVLAGIEWNETRNGQNPFFAIGLFNGGTYNRTASNTKWKKLPVAGVDFNMLVKKE